MKIVQHDTHRVKSIAKRSFNRHVTVTLLELVSQDVALTERRGEWWGLCPFHAEQTPSFSVNAHKGVYSCFGCGAKGDAIDYLRAARGYGFAEAAARVGKEVAPPRGPAQRAREAALLAEYAAWWQGKLRAWNALLDDLRWTEQTYRDQCTALGEGMSDRSFASWSRRLGDLYFQQTVMQQLLDRSDAERFAAWREERGDHE